MNRPPISDTEAMTQIHALLSGVEWTGDTIEHVGEIVEATGRTILPPAEPEDDDPTEED